MLKFFQRQQLAGRRRLFEPKEKGPLEQSESSPGRWFLNGILAGFGAQAIMLVARLVVGAPSFAEVLSDWLLYLLPGALAGFIIDRLQFLTKPLLFILLVVAQVLTAGLIGLWIGLRRTQISSVTHVPVTIAAVTTAVMLAVLAFVIEALSTSISSYAASTDGGLPVIALVLALSFAVFAALLVVGMTLLAVGPTVTAEETPSLGRRELLIGGLGALGVAITGGSMFRIIGTMGEQASIASIAASIPPLAPTPDVPPSAQTATGSATTPGLTPAAGQVAVPTGLRIPFPAGTSALVTSPKDFYVISKNFVDPVVNVDSWSLEMTGLVGKPAKIALKDLMGFPQTTRYQTLECISNAVGGDLESNAQWTGVLFTDFFKDLGVKSTARDANFTAVDGFTNSMPLTVLLDGYSLLAHTMDGQLLPSKHGAPARVLLLNRYGMKQPKWLQKIELSANGVVGYWEQRGWSDQAYVQTMSRIDVPRGGEGSVGKPVDVSGIAFAGARGISKVELSIDGGMSWLRTDIEPQLNTLTTWIRWYYRWTPDKAGQYRFTVRATDGSNVVQTPEEADTYPNGATGYDRRDFSVG